jgi:hypothetical protein
LEAEAAAGVTNSRKAVINIHLDSLGGRPAMGSVVAKLRKLQKKLFNAQPTESKRLAPFDSLEVIDGVVVGG